MLVLFCRPESPQVIDDRFELEMDALDELGILYRSIAMEAVTDGALELALPPAEEILYRGWMLTADEYAWLDDAVAACGSALITDRDAYEAAHYLPSNHDAIAHLTAPTVWTEGTDVDEAWALARREIGPPPYVVKDHVKSAKEHWADACFVAAGADRDEFARVCANLIELRADRFERGLVVRAFQPIAHRDGAPDEYRLWFWRGRLVAASAYHDALGDLSGLERLADLGGAIDSPFFTVDVARLVSGALSVIEVGDGGVSTVPPTLDPRDLYRALIT